MLKESIQLNQQLKTKQEPVLQELNHLKHLSVSFFVRNITNWKREISNIDSKIIKSSPVFIAKSNPEKKFLILMA